MYLAKPMEIPFVVRSLTNDGFLVNKRISGKGPFSYFILIRFVIGIVFFRYFFSSSVFVHVGIPLIRHVKVVVVFGYCESGISSAYVSYI